MGFWDWIKKTFGAGDETATRPRQEASPEARAAESAAGREAGGPAEATKADYSVPDIIGLSQEELQERAGKMAPWRRWTWDNRGRIPDGKDERTALIERAMVLHGTLTDDELAEIHAIGDEYLPYLDREGFARQSAVRAGAGAVDELRQQRAEVKAQRKRESAERKSQREAAIADRHANDVVFLGRGVSAQLHDRRSHIEKIEALGLPVLASPKDIAEWLGIEVPRLRWLAFHGDATERSHYVRFEVPKRSGGIRVLSAPHAELKAVQKKIHTDLIAKIPLDDTAHGFAKGRSVVTNATKHVARDVIVTLDIKDFFPTISFVRVRGLFKALGYSPAASTVIAALTTAAPTRPIEYDGKKYEVAVGDPVLPQGAPTSPGISNLIARRLDRRLNGLARKAGWTYTRYADDLAFSAGSRNKDKVPWLIRQVKEIVKSEGFTVHAKKGRVMRKGGKQQITGVIVNDKPGLDRREVRRLRAVLHRAKREGLAAQNRENHPKYAAHLRGKLAYLAMIDPAKGKAMLAELDALDGPPSP